MFPLQSFGDFNCGYEYVSDDFQELKYLRGDPFGKHGGKIKKGKDVIKN